MEYEPASGVALKGHKVCPAYPGSPFHFHYHVLDDSVFTKLMGYFHRPPILPKGDMDAYQVARIPIRDLKGYDVSLAALFIFALKIKMSLYSWSCPFHGSTSFWSRKP